MRLTCFEPHARRVPFAIDVDPEVTISELQLAIKQQFHPAYAHRTLDHLCLFLARCRETGGASLVDDTMRNLEGVDALLRTQAPLSTTARVRGVLHDLPADGGNVIHVLVSEWVGDTNAKDPCLGSLAPVRKAPRCGLFEAAMDKLTDHDEADPRLLLGAITWGAIKAVFHRLVDPTFCLTPKSVPAATLNLLETIYTMKEASYSLFLPSEGASQLLFIEPILLAVANACEPRVRIDVHDRLDGHVLNVGGEVAFVLTRPRVYGRRKRVCVVMAKYGEGHGASVVRDGDDRGAGRRRVLRIRPRAMCGVAARRSVSSLNGRKLIH